jgi:hypothetical protein
MSETLLARIASLEQIINNQTDTTSNTGTNNNKKKDKKKDKEYVCVFDKCPDKGEGYNWMFNDAIRLKKGNICFFNKCKKGGTPLGSLSGKTLCSYKTCPAGSTKLLKSNLNITPLGKGICIYPNQTKCPKKGLSNNEIFKGIIKLNGSYCSFPNKNCPKHSIKIGKSFCQYPNKCPANTESFSLKHIME